MRGWLPFSRPLRGARLRVQQRVGGGEQSFMELRRVGVRILGDRRRDAAECDGCHADLVCEVEVVARQDALHPRALLAPSGHRGVGERREVARDVGDQPAVAVKEVEIGVRP